MTTRSFLPALGLRLRPRDGEAHGDAELGPNVWAKGTERPRLGALATMTDIVAGMRPSGPLQPTVDLTIRLVTAPPPTGRVHLECRPLKIGRRLFVGEVLIDHDGAPIAQGVATFLNRPYTGPPAPPPTDPPPAAEAIPFDDWLRPQFVDERTVLVEKDEAITNGPGGTVQGGLQATLAELAAEWALAPRGDFVVVDLDIRYLGPVVAGPLRARADVLAAGDDRAVVRVELDDAGAGTSGRPVAHVTTVCEPALRWTPP